MLFALALQSVISRSMPLGLESGQIVGVRLRIQSDAIPNASQIGRIQVVTWNGSSRLEPKELASLITGWTRTPETGVISFERTRGSIKQFMQISNPGRGFGLGVTPQEPQTGISISEIPPEDGTVPSDWPRNFKRGIYRVLPDMVRIVKGKEPVRVRATQNPAGEGGEASYHIAIGPKVAKLDIQKQFPGWELEGDDSSYTVHEPYSQPFVRDENRALRSVSVREAPGGSIVDVYWRPGIADRTALDESYPDALIARSPKSKVPKLLSPDFRKRLFRKATKPFSSFGPRWEYSIKISMTELETKLSESKVKFSRISGGSLSLDLSTKDTTGYLQVFKGRVLIRKEIPKGYKATRDIGRNFADYVVQDLDTFVHVVLSESKRAQT
ncbi:MAG: hypothetical protein ABL962_16005 [Fimbriimonadaceae bacterium]